MYCKSNCQMNPSESKSSEIAENDLRKERKKTEKRIRELAYQRVSSFLLRFPRVVFYDGRAEQIFYLKA